MLTYFSTVSALSPTESLRDGAQRFERTSTQVKVHMRVEGVKNAADFSLIRWLVPLFRLVHLAGENAYSLIGTAQHTRL